MLESSAAEVRFKLADDAIGQATGLFGALLLESFRNHQGELFRESLRAGT